MFDRRRPHLSVVIGGKIQTRLVEIFKKPSTNPKFEFPALSDDGRPSFQIEFVQERLD